MLSCRRVYLATLQELPDKILSFHMKNNTKFLLLGGLFVLSSCFSALSYAQNTPLANAEKLYNAGKKTEALAIADKVLQEKPSDPQMRFLKAVILTEQNKTTEAIDIYTGLMRDFPELPEPYNNVAVLYNLKGQPELSKVALESAIRNNPGYAVAHENLGDIYIQLASASYKKAQKLGVNSASLKAKLLRTESVIQLPTKQ